MGHEQEGLTAKLLHDGGHALTAVGVAHLILIIAIGIFDATLQTALLVAGAGGFLLSAGIQEYLDYRRWGLTLDSIHDVFTYAPILGLHLILAGEIIFGIVLLVSIAAVEVIFLGIDVGNL